MKAIYIWFLLLLVVALCYGQDEKKEDALDKDGDKKDADDKKDDKKEDGGKPDKKPDDNSSRPRGLLALLDVLSRILRNDCFNDVDCLETAATRGRLPPMLIFLSRIFEGLRDIRRMLFGSNALERELEDERTINVDLSPLDILNPFRRFGRRGLPRFDADVLDSRIRNNEIDGFERLLL